MGPALLFVYRCRSFQLQRPFDTVHVIQILLMPLIMVGQNLQNRHTEIRAELDFQINRKAEQEIAFLMRHMERNTTLLLHLMKHMDCRIGEEEIRAIQAENELAAQLAAATPKAVP